MEFHEEEEEGVEELGVIDDESYDRRRSVTSATPRSCSRPVTRGRSHSSAGPHGIYPFATDVSALSVEVAVAKVQQQQQEWHRQQQQQQQPTELELEERKKHSHRRSRSMMSRVLTPMRGSSGLSSSRERGSRMLSMDERFRRNSSNALRTERASSIDIQQEEKQREEELLQEDESEREEQEQEHQHVVRRHEPQQSVPSVIDLFRLQPAKMTGDTLSPVAARAGAPSLSTSGNLAGSLSARHQPHQQQRNDDVRKEGEAQASASSDSHSGRWCFDAGGQPQRSTSPPLAENYTYYPALNSPPTAYRDGSAGTAAPTPPLPTATGGDSTNIVKGNDDDAGSTAGSSPRGGPQQEHQRLRHQQRWPGGSHFESTAPAPVPAVAIYTEEPLYTGGTGFAGSGSGSTPVAALQQQDLARHMREASTNTVDAGREGRVAFSGGVAAAGRSDGRAAAEVRD